MAYVNLDGQTRFLPGVSIHELIQCVKGGPGKVVWYLGIREYPVSKARRIYKALEALVPKETR